MNNKFKVGDRVWYTSGYWGVCSYNPLKGSKYQCIGTVVKIHNSGETLDVDWDNGEGCAYYKKDLTKVADYKFLFRR